MKSVKMMVNLKGSVVLSKLKEMFIDLGLGDFTLV